MLTDDSVVHSGMITGDSVVHSGMITDDSVVHYGTITDDSVVHSGVRIVVSRGHFGLTAWHSGNECLIRSTMQSLVKASVIWGIILG